MDLLLVSPPVGNVGQAAPALSVLTAFLRSRGWDVHQWDLSIDAFHYFHEKRSLERCREAVLHRGADRELVAAAARAVDEIDAAKDLLRQRDGALDPGALRRAFAVLGDAGVLLTAAAHGRYVLDFRHFEIPGAIRDFDSLAAALRDPEANPFLEYFERRALPRLLRERPAAVGISITYFSQLIPGFALARSIKRHLPETRVILGGGYLTATAEDVLAMPTSLAPADALVLHDGEDALDAWLGSVLRGRGHPTDAPNVCLPVDGVFRKATGGPPHHTDLDALPVPMWTAHGLELERYLVPKYAVGLPLTRGCHWGRCVYCNISNQTSATYRRRSSEQAVADMRAIMAETGSNWFDFPVDSYRARDLVELSRAITAAGLEVEWAAEVLFDRGFTAQALGELRRAGCRSLRFGLESGSLATLKAMRKPMRPASAAKILSACREHGIRTGVMLIAGFPSETQAGLGETFDFLVEHRGCIDFIGIHPFSLVPGSPMSRDPGKFGLYLGRRGAVFATSLPFHNANPVAMRPEDLPRVIDAMKEGLLEHYPDLNELWTAAIGGWMTFATCCARERPDGRHPAATEHVDFGDGGHGVPPFTGER